MYLDGHALIYVKIMCHDTGIKAEMRKDAVRLINDFLGEKLECSGLGCVTASARTDRRAHT